MKKILLLVLIYLFINQTGYSQDNNGAWTLEQCIEYALKHNIRIMRSQNDFDQSRVDLNQSRAAMVPSLNMFATHAYGFGRVIDPSTNLFDNRTIRNNQFGLNSDVILFNGMQLQNQVRQNQLISEANIASLEQARNDVSINVAGAFLSVLLNDALLQNAIFQKNTSTEQLDRTERLVQAGSLPRASFLEIKAQNATDELAVVNAENQLELSKLQLMQFLQLPYNENFRITSPDIEDFDDLQLELGASQIYEMALTTQPIMRSMDLRFRSAIMGEKIARGANSPSLVAFGNVNSFYSSNRVTFPDMRRMSFSDQLENTFGQNVGLRLNIPIFNNWRVKADQQRAVIFKKSTEINKLETENNLRQEVEQAYLDARAASKTFISVQNQVEALQEAFRVTEQRFNLGAANAVDYNVSRNNLNQAESDMIRAKYDYIFRMKVLDFYQGKALSLN